MNRDLFHILLILAIILLGIWMYKQSFRLKANEGFCQKDRFILKIDGDSYDDFYSEIYDEIPSENIDYQVQKVLSMLQPEPRFSTFLDVGSGTGHLVDVLKKWGYRAYGIEKSGAMIKKSEEKYPEIEIKNDNVENPMAFDRALFTHIFCIDFTIYEIENKMAFFKNCFYWLQNNGYLIIHLAERTKFTPLGNSAFDLLGKRVLKKDIEYHDFKYAAEYLPKNENIVLFKETFVDKQTNNIRQNERTLVMESPDEILAIARIAGFVAKGSFQLDADKWQQIVILERVA